MLPPEPGRPEHRSEVPSEDVTVAAGAGDRIGSGTESTDPEATDPGRPRRSRSRRRRRYVAIGVAAAVLIGAIVTLNVVHVGFYMLGPGSVRRTEDLIGVDGQQTFSDPGSISYTTVSFTQASVWNKLTARFNESIDLVDEDTILQGQDPDQNRKENLEMMDVSKQYATVVALRKLGYKVDTKGTGAVVVGFADGGPARESFAEGDAIVEVDGTPIATRDDLIKALADKHPGDVVAITSEPDRSGKRETKNVTLAARPDDATKGFLGVQLVTRDLDFIYPFRVNIDSGQVGGPSAGLAFTLGVIDVLTPGSLTGGNKVATTGTIDIDGRVGPVGGVKQKTFAVRASGARLFLVPPEEYDEARTWAGEDLKVVKVETLEEALDVISQNGGNTGPVAEKAAANQARPAN